jgi:hypothetical protein
MVLRAVAASMVRHTAGIVERTTGDAFELHARQWEAKGEPGVLADPRVQGFHRDSAPRLTSYDFLRGDEAYEHDWRARDTFTYSIILTGVGTGRPAFPG